MTRNITLKYWVLISVVWILGVSLLIYGRTLGFEFLTWDDDFNIYQNPWIVGRDLYGLVSAPYYGLYVPVTYSVWYGLFHLAALFSGLPTSGFFHGANLFLHTLNSLTVYFLVKFLLGDTDFNKRSTYSTQSIQIASLLGALTFCCHPLQVDTVAWASGLRDLLGAFFCFNCIYIYLKYRTLKGWFVASILFALAILSKPSGITLPFILVFLEVAVWPDATSKDRFLRLVPWVAFGFVLIRVTQGAQSYAHVPVVSWFLRPGVMLDSLFFYIGKLFFPWKLSLDYQKSIQIVSGRLADPYYYGSLLMVGCLFLSGLFKLRSQLSSLGGGALLFFLLSWLPISGIASFAFQSTSTVANHYMYFPLFGFSLGLALLILGIQSRFFSKIPIKMTLPLIFLSLSLSLFCWTPLALSRVGLWKNDRSLFQQMILDNPNNSQALNAMGRFASSDGRLNEARLYFKKGHELSPWMVEVYANYAQALYALKNYDDLLNEVLPEFINKSRNGITVEAMPPLEVVVSILTQTLLKVGQLNEARQVLCQYKQMSPIPSTILPGLWKDLSEQATFRHLGTLLECRGP